MSTPSFLDSSGFSWKRASNFLIIQHSNSKTCCKNENLPEKELNYYLYEENTNSPPNNAESLNPIFVNLNYRKESEIKNELDKSTKLKLKKPTTNKSITVSQKIPQQTIYDTYEIKSEASKKSKNEKKKKYRKHRCEVPQVKNDFVPQLECIYTCEVDRGGTYKFLEPKSLPLEQTDRKHKGWLKGTFRKSQMHSVGANDNLKLAKNDLKKIPPDKVKSKVDELVVAKTDRLENDLKCDNIVDTLRVFVAATLQSQTAKQSSELVTEDFYSKLNSKMQDKVVVSGISLVDKIDQLLEILSKQYRNQEKLSLDILSLFLDM